MGEIWKESNVYKGYLVSNMGRVARIKNVCANSRGYLHTKINDVKVLVHRLVAMTFIREPKSGEQVNHKDGNITNNCIENLEWVSASENVIHAINVLGKKSCKKKVARLTLKSGKVKIYESISEAERENKLGKDNLRNYIRKEVVVKNRYKFFFVDETEYKELF